MTDAVLNAEELAALRSTVSNSAGEAGASREDQLAEPIALIADDRAGREARPAAMALARRWTEVMLDRIRRSMSLNLDLKVSSSEAVPGTDIRNALTDTWTQVLQLETGAIAMITVRGPLLGATAVYLLGGDEPKPEDDNKPSTVARGIFGRAGRLMISAFEDAWHEVDRRALVVLDEARGADAAFRLTQDERLLVTTIEVESPARGQIELVARPDTLIAPRMPVVLTPAPIGTVRQTLGAVPITISVELGQASLSMREVAALRPGMLIELDRTIEDNVVVRCEGVAKALAQPLNAHGSLVVEVVSTVFDKEVD